MKHWLNLVGSAVMLWTVTACANASTQVPTPAITQQMPAASPVPSGSELYGVFQANTPCSAEARPLPQIPADAACEQMKWNLILYQDTETGAPTTYNLTSSYGMAKPNTNDLIDGGTSIEMKGNWTITAGTKSNPEAIVYQLNDKDSQDSVSFLKVSDDMLHVLGREKALLVGNGAWSYTLNRMDHKSPTEIVEQSRPDPPPRPPQPAMPAGSSIFAIFDGRTPCDEVVLEFTNTESFPGCLKIKWRLTLYQDSASGEPTRYLFMSTSQFREGSWRIISGTDVDPNTVIYELQPVDTKESFYFQKVDKNHLYLMDGEQNLLIGNELFSYTLSRVEPGVQ
ncbi:MAG TPA: hypothetical protein VFQ23_00480 [Anaerolineales bacterium]|nr:hypothetical protein [Anaerolineales bacterium]